MTIKKFSNNDIDYEDIYDNIDDYEYPCNRVNRRNFVGIKLKRTHTHVYNNNIIYNIITISYYIYLLYLYYYYILLQA